MNEKRRKIYFPAIKTYSSSFLIRQRFYLGWEMQGVLLVRELERYCRAHA